MPKKTASKIEERDLFAMEKSIEIGEFNLRETDNNLTKEQEKIKSFIGFHFVAAGFVFTVFNSADDMPPCLLISAFVFWVSFWLISFACLIRCILARSIPYLCNVDEFFEKPSSKENFLKKYHKRLKLQREMVLDLLKERSFLFKLSLGFFTLSFVPLFGLVFVKILS